MKVSWTTANLADRIGVTDRHVRFLIKQGKITAQRFGKAWMIEDEEAERVIGEYDKKTAQSSDKS
jgi:excisionase family DNA binding protein